MPERIELIRHTDPWFGENCWLLVGPSKRRAAIVDPGFESERLAAVLDERELDLEWIVNTHGHIDHVARNRWWHERTGAPIVAHRGDREMLRNVRIQLAELRRLGFGLDIEVEDSPEPQAWFEPGTPFVFDGVAFEVLHTPGHSPGGVCLRFGERCLVGDTLFQGSIGRTDLPGGSMPELLKSIRETLFRLPGSTVCLPGHGEPTTIDAERRSNPFVSDRAIAWAGGTP